MKSADGPWEWQCGECGTWVGSGWAMHVHYETREPTLAEMIDARRAEYMLPGTYNPLAPVELKRTTYFRMGGEPTRDAKL